VNKEVPVAAVSWLKYAYLAHFSKPRTQRQLYRLVKVHNVGRIVEVGIDSIERTAAMIAVAQRFAGASTARRSSACSLGA
jgi:hypothetical protein